MGARAFQGFQTVLVAWDGSPQAEHSLEVALSLASSTGARVVVLAVIRPPEPAESAELNAVLEEARERYERNFASMHERAKEAGVALETEVAVGHPAEQIIHKAETAQASLIVMGRRSHTVFHRWMLGSNSERVVRSAYCPVMVVH
jgi:nucleotide-binding universal stress UspA family protein